MTEVCRPPGVRFWTALALFAMVWLVVAWWIRHEFLPYDVNNTDIGTSLFQAETFAGGHLSRLTPEPREFFAQWQAIVRDHSYAYYPPAHALMLTVPLRLGLDPWLVPWLAGALTLIATALWVRRLAGPVAGALAAGLLLMSPFFVANAISLLSHSTTLLLTILFLLAVTRWAQRGDEGAVLATGLLLAAILAARPVNALALGLAWMPWLFSIQRKNGGGAHLASRVACRVSHVSCFVLRVSFFLTGFAALFLPLLLHNHALTGRWTLNLFTDYWPRNRYGFGAGLGRGEPGHFFQTYANHDLAGWIANVKYTFAGLMEWWTGQAWVSVVLLGGVVVLAAWRWGRKEGRTGPEFAVPLVLWPILHIGLYAGYFTQSTPMTGPRYASELLPWLALASAWGITRLATFRPGNAMRWAAGALVILVAINGVRATAHFAILNGKGIAARRLVERCVRDGARSPSLVFLRSFWIGHPLPIFRNSPGADGPILFACDRGAEDRRLVERHPERNAFVLVIAPEPGGSVHAELIPIYRAVDRTWLQDPSSIRAPFFLGSRFSVPVELRGETWRKLFHPRPEDIEPQ